MNELIFATNNGNKIKEISALLDKSIKLLSLQDIGFSGDIPETYPTIEQNALQKTQYVYDKYKLPCFADDTGLEVEALNNEPGVLSARYAGEKNNFTSIDELTEANIIKLLDKLKDKTNRKARFKTVISLIIDKQAYSFEGIVNGQIINEKKGKQGFGYDPVFLPDGYNITFAEMPLEIKNTISHRAKAINKLVSFLNKNI